MSFALQARRVVLRLLLSLVFVYFTVCALVFINQRHLIFPVPAGARMPKLFESRLLRIPGPEGTTVFAFHYPAPPGARTVVHFHGNGEQLADEIWLGQRFDDAGLGFFAVEYPGYGLAKGDGGPTEKGIYAAAQAALEYLHGTLGVSKEDTVLEGQSLGSGVAAEMATRGFGSRLVLITPYTSITDIGARLFPWLPARLLVKDPFDTASKAPGVKLPVFILHGTLDEVVPVDMGERLGTIFPHATVRLLEGKHHNNVLDAGDIREELFRFVKGDPRRSEP